VTCNACGFQNPSGMKFCGECAAPLASCCPACGCDNPPGFKFCGRCGAPLARPISSDVAAGLKPASGKVEHAAAEHAGQRPAATSGSRPPNAHTPRHLAEKILQSKSALEGERKQVTVLFADVKGSMELAEQLDPEEWSQIMQRFFQILSDGVERFEGFVDKFTGDGIMALFGAPIAHEDHAQRACYAALHLQDQLRRYADELRLQRGMNFSARMGLNSGEVVVGKIGDDLRMEFTAIGHTVGLAQRMEQVAAADRVALSEHTARLVAPYFELRDLGRLRLKGAAEPVGVFELEGSGPARTRLDVSRSRGFTRFVGRERETATLDAALQRALDGETQIVGVVGEPGVGKSRLCIELLARARAQSIAVYEGHCLSHGRALPFHPILQLFRAYFGIHETDPPAEARRKIAGTLVLLDDRLREALPLVFDFLGVSDPSVPGAERPPPRLDPDARQRQLVAFTGELLRARSAREPAVLLIDDLHWIDPASDALLAPIIEVMSGTRTLVLLNFRPEYSADWMRRANYQQVALRPLGPEAIEELLRALLGDDASLAPLLPRLRERAGGNPFFAEELVQSLVEAGTLSGTKGACRLEGSVGERVLPSLPPSVQAILAARIDRLAEPEKRTLEAAAVIGREVFEPLLRRVCDEITDLPAHLATLVRKELLFEQALYPEIIYAFKHPLTHEVAYRTQLTARRARMHARVAEALEVIHAADANEHAALIAQHWSEAGETLRAMRWYARAAAWSGVRDLAEATRQLAAVRRLAGTAPESPEVRTLASGACSGLLNLGWRAGLSEEDAGAIFAEGTRFADANGDLAARARLLNAYAVMRTLTGHGSEGRALVAEALGLAQRLGDRALELALHQRMQFVEHSAGDGSAALAWAEKAIALAQGDLKLGADVLGFSPALYSMVTRVFVLALFGRNQQWLTAYAEVERLALEHDEIEIAILVASWRCRTHILYGDPAAARRDGARAVEMAEQLGSPFWIAIAAASLAAAYIEEGSFAEALRLAERGLVAVRGWNPVLEAALLTQLAQSYAGKGDARAAGARVHEAAMLIRRMSLPGLAGTFNADKVAGLLLRTGGASPEAVEWVELAERVARESGSRALEPDALLVRAELERLRGDDAARQRALQEAHRILIEIGATARAERLATELGR
jgi:class 3 adenylate cyclase/tetratricopeptide (TPR) repeat protein